MAGPAAIGVEKNFVELCVTSEVGIECGFGKAGFGGTVPFVPEAGQAEGVAVLVDGNSDLFGEEATEVGGACPAPSGDGPETVVLMLLGEDREGFDDAGVEGDGAAAHGTACPAPPAQKQKVVEARVEAFGVTVAEAEV